MANGIVMVLHRMVFVGVALSSVAVSLAWFANTATAADVVTAAPSATPAKKLPPSSSATNNHANSSSSADKTALACELVEQLGDKKFAVREAAHRKLLQLGPIAFDAVEAGLSDTSAEVRQRCKQIYRILQYQRQQKQLEEFVQDVDGKKGTSLPGWNRFRKIAGNDLASRKLFAAMWKAEPELLELFIHGKLDIAVGRGIKTCWLRQREIAIARRKNKNKNVVSGDIILAHVSAAIFVLGDDKVTFNHEMMVRVQSFCMWEVTCEAVKKSDFRKPYLCLLRRFITHPSRGLDSYDLLRLGKTYNLKEQIVPARSLLQFALNSYHTCHAIQTVAKFGSRDDIAALQPHVQNTNKKASVVYRDKNKKHIVRRLKDAKRLPLRDLALAASIHLSGQRLADFGYSRVTTQPPDFTDLSSFVFDTDKQRQKAHTKWAAFLAKQKEETGKTKDAKSPQVQP